jgi:hypothetical protein
MDHDKLEKIVGSLSDTGDRFSKGFSHMVWFSCLWVPTMDVDNRSSGIPLIDRCLHLLLQ